MNTLSKTAKILVAAVAGSLALGAAAFAQPPTSEQAVPARKKMGQVEAPAQPNPVPTEETATDIPLTNPAIKSGLNLRVVGRKIVIGAGQLEVAGKTIEITPTKVIVPPPGPLSTNDEIIRFMDNGKPTDTVVVAKCRAALNDSAILHGVLVPGSLRLKTAPGGAPAFLKTKDYIVNEDLGAVRAIAGGTIKPGDKAFADYQCWRRRIDAIAYDPADGHFVLIQGVPARSAPEPPEVSSQLIPLANVYSDWGDGDIPTTDVMPIAERDFTPNQKLAEHNRRAMDPVIKKLESGEPVHIVFWGDSITQGFDARSKENSFPQLFVKQLSASFPKAKITTSNLGISSSDSSSRLPALKVEVFSIKPDVVIVEFVNDFALPSHVLQKNYEVLLDTAKEKNVRVILCAPNLPSPRVARAVSWEAVADRPYIALLRELANNNDDVAMADVSSRFMHLSKEGMRPEMLYVNGLNNPNNRGHAIYAEELLRCFVPTNQIASH